MAFPMFLEGAFSVASSQTTKIQGYKDADALYAFKSRGFGGEIGVMAPALTAEISCAYHNMVFPG